MIKQGVNEPFRLFFPAAVIAGLAGVLLWPLHFAQFTEFYPGPSHARLMAHGFFGGFILGFLGTAFPRLMEAPGFSAAEIGILLLVFVAMTIAHAFAFTASGDGLFLLLLVLLLLFAVSRFLRRKDLPPPGFVLVPAAIFCGIFGAILSILEQRAELDGFWLLLRPLLYYQGFVLLPILGVGGFILPRFFGLPNQQEFPASIAPQPAWIRRMAWAGAVGILILVSFVIEAAGWARLGHLLRLCGCAGWLLHEVPIHTTPSRSNHLATGLRIAFGMLFAGILVISLSPSYRVAWLHLTLVGGFGVMTLAVATRVVYAHTGAADRLTGANGWFLCVIGLMLAGMATRISGDFWPKILISHYNYGAGLWSAAMIWWAVKVLPRVRIQDLEG